MQVWSLLGTIAICVWLGWTIFWPHATYSKQPVSLKEFTDQLGIQPPPTATNFLFAKSYVGVRCHARFYRFDAPVADCLSYARELIALNQQGSDTEHQVTNDLQTLASPPAPIEAASLRLHGHGAIRWFDIENISTGYVGSEPVDVRASFWVDTERGRFYYCWTD